MKGASKLTKAGLAFILILIVGGFLWTLWLFPSALVKTWVESLNVPGKLTVRGVSMAPLMDVTFTNPVFRPRENPVLREIAFDRIAVKPAWSRIIRGERALNVRARTGASVLSGNVVKMSKGDAVIRLSADEKIPLPFPFKFHKGFSLQGTWTFMVDLRVIQGQTRGTLSGTWECRAKDLKIAWEKAPALGMLNLSFVSVLIRGRTDRSVFNAGEIALKGNDLDVEGKAVFWLDPVTRKMQVKGTLFLRPKGGLAVSNASLDAAIRMLPRDSKGFRLAF